MRANKDRLGTECPQLREQLLTILHVSVIRLVIAEITPDRSHLSAIVGRVNADRDGKRSRHLGLRLRLLLTEGNTGGRTERNQTSDAQASNKLPSS